MTTSIEHTITHYIASQILAGDRTGLDAQTPLLEWGILNSMEVLGLVDFLEDTFGIEIGAEDLRPHNLSDIAAIAALVRTRRS